MANISTVISSVAYWSTFVQLPVVYQSTVGPVSRDSQTRKEKLQWIFKQWVSGLQWNSAKVLHWRENRERPSITPNALTGVRVAIHHHLTCAPLAETLTFCKTKKRQRIQVCQQKYLKQRPSNLWKKNAKPKHNMYDRLTINGSC